MNRFIENIANDPEAMTILAVITIVLFFGFLAMCITKSGYGDRM